MKSKWGCASDKVHLGNIFVNPLGSSPTHINKSLSSIFELSFLILRFSFPLFSFEATFLNSSKS